MKEDRMYRVPVTELAPGDLVQTSAGGQLVKAVRRISHDTFGPAVEAVYQGGAIARWPITEQVLVG